MDCSNNNCSSCISDILKRILLLQKQESSCESFAGCDKPFLGPIIQNACYNTRPILLYNCATVPSLLVYSKLHGLPVAQLYNIIGLVL